LDPLLARRNVVLRGAEVEALRGELFSLDGVLRLGPAVLASAVMLHAAHAGNVVRPSSRAGPARGSARRAARESPAEE
jgi:hypothetical protein